MKPTLKYQIVEKPMLGVMVIQSGELKIKTIKREQKYDGYSGYDAFILKEPRTRWPDVTARSFPILLRKLAKLEGVERQVQ